MIIGSRNIPRVIEESFCKNSEDSYFTEIGDYKIHSKALMPMIEFEKANELFSFIFNFELSELKFKLELSFSFCENKVKLLFPCRAT